MRQFVDCNNQSVSRLWRKFTLTELKLEPIENFLGCSHVVIASESQALQSEFLEAQATFEVNADKAWFGLSVIKFSQHLSQQFGLSAAGAANQNCVRPVVNK
jgi:hypothetical protein